MSSESARVPASADSGAQRGRAGLLAGWPRGTRLGALCLALLVVPGLLAGGAPLDAGRMLLFYVGWVLLPGLAVAGLLAEEDDELLSAGMALASGTVLLGLLEFACRATGLFGALFLWPLVALGGAFLLRRRARGAELRAARGLTPKETGLLLVVLAIVLLRVPTGLASPAAGWSLMQNDLVFHAGNAVELTRTGPLLDPRVAGRPLNYHLLSHTLAAAARVVTGVTMAELFRVWFLGFYPLVLAMLVFALARVLARSAWAGFFAALALALHHDLGRGLFARPPRTGLGFLSHLDVGIFVSPTTCLGLVLLVALTRALMRWVDPARRVDARAVGELALLALGASMAKGSVMPVAVAGAGLACVLGSVRARRWNGRWASATAVMGLAALPATLYLALGPGSYAGSMFRPAPWATASATPLGAWLVESLPFLGHAPTWLTGLVLTLPWVPGFLGLGGVGALAWLASGRADLAGLGPWILGVFLAGLGASVMLIAPGSSQLFFAYNAQALLALPAGVAAVAAWRRRPALALLLTLLALPFALSGASGLVRNLRERARVAKAPPNRWSEWYEAATWLRENTGPQALLVGGVDGFLLTQFAERRVGYTQTSFAPEGHAAWQKVDGEWRFGPAPDSPLEALDKAVLKVFRKYTPAALEELRRALGRPDEWILIRSSVSLGSDLGETKISRAMTGGPIDSSPELERVFQNEAMGIYRVKD